MASAMFEIDDQTDEDFFDKLIEDEVEELPKTAVQAVTVNAESQGFGDKKGSDVSQTNVDSSLNLNVGIKDDVNNGIVVGNEAMAIESVVKNQLDSEIEYVGRASEVKVKNVNAVTDIPVDEAVGESNSLQMRMDETVNVVNQMGSVSPVTGIREVDWSVFSSESRVQNSPGMGSYSDFFGAMEIPDGDPFANLNNSSEGAYGYSVEGIGENYSVSGSVLVDHQGIQNHGTDVSLNTYGQINLNYQYSENLYPGWRLNPETGLWQQLDTYDAISNDNLSSQNVSEVTSVSDNQFGMLQVPSFDQFPESSHSVSGISEDVSSFANDSNYNSQNDATYPENMVFDPQYPGWYYDTTVGEWHTLESYTMSVNQSGILNRNLLDQPSYNSPDGGYQANNLVSYGSSHIQDNGNGSTGKFPVQVATSSVGEQHNGQNTHMWQPEPVSVVEACTSTPRSVNTQRYSFDGYSESTPQKFLVPSSEGHPESVFHQPTIPLSNQWSSDRRPYHPLVTFGFGGKLIIMKSDSHFGTVDAYETQNTAGRVIDVLSLKDIAMDRLKNTCTGMDAADYFAALCQPSFPGPLVSSSVGVKEINKWVDEKIENYKNSYSKEGKTMKLLFALLKVACQHYGKLRSPFGGDYPLLEKESPEFTIGNLFASLKTDNGVIHGTMNPLIQNWPSERQVQATTYEMQNLLISGRKKEALECAKQGHLWGPAIVLAAQLGDQFYSETMKEMALQQFIAGSPLRTLYLLIAGKPNDAFTNTNTTVRVSGPGVPDSLLPSMQVQRGSNPVLDDWVENLSVIMTNRTKDDELAIIHLGDCLWKERSEVTGAHICYLVADTNFESYSDSARLCLIGADHIGCPRTYAHPEAIQRTELYEYAKVLGNAQFTLFHFLPYKLIYAQMLAEVGKLSESMKYCQAILKILKSGRGQEEDLCKQLVSSLEERIRTHQQAGYTTNLAPVKLVGKLLSVWSNARGSAGPSPTFPSPSSSTFQPKDVVNQYSQASPFSSGLPPQVPSQSSDIQNHNGVPQFSPYRGGSNSQSTLSMSALVPQIPSESVSKPTDGDVKLVTPSRSISEPDIGKTPKGEPKQHEPKPHEAQLKTAVSANPSRFGRILQKTVGLVLRPRTGNQAKLGEKNKFFYDEKLKRWVEEGAEPPVEEVALPPPPTTGSFQNKESDHTESAHANNAPNETSNAKSLEMSPPVPAGPPQFSGRGRVGVRSRYVDTFNKAGGSSSNLFKPPSTSTFKSGVVPNPTFFVPPATVPVGEAVLETADGNVNTDTPSELLSTVSNEPLRSPESGLKTGSTYATPSTSLHGSSTSLHGSSFQSSHMSTASLSSDSAPMQRSPSFDDKQGTEYSYKPEARRTASWSGGANNISRLPSGEPYGSSSPDMTLSSGTSFNQHNQSSDDLQEVDI